MTTEQKAVDMVLRRTDIIEDDAKYYIDLAELKIRNYLKLAADETLEQYLFNIVDIAVLMYQSDAANKSAGSSLAYKSESMSEGGVSHSVTAYNGAEIHGIYDAKINEILEQLNSSIGQVMFL